MGSVVGHLASYLSTPCAGRERVRDPTVGRLERRRFRRWLPRGGLGTWGHGFLMVSKPVALERKTSCALHSYALQDTFDGSTNANANVLDAIDMVFTRLRVRFSREVREDE